MRIGSAMYAFCQDVEEDALHVLRDCHMVMPLWFSIIHINVRVSFFPGNIDHWIKMNMSSNMEWNEHEDWKALWVTPCYSLWRWHNTEIYGDNFNRPYYMEIHIRMMVSDYDCAKLASKIIVHHQREV